MNESPGSLLCVANFPANTGYAWHFIESLYRGVAESFGPRGIRTWVAYPEIDDPPASLAGSCALPVELDVQLNTWKQLTRTIRFVRQEDIRAIYLTDRSAWNPAYVLLRLAGVRWIVVHDHTSGDRTSPRGLRRIMKWIMRRVPGMLADEVVAVSDFVRRRKLRVEMLSPSRVHRIWNSIEMVPLDDDAPARLRSALGIAPDRPVVVCVGRAEAEKGVEVLLKAFDALMTVWPSETPRPMLIYIGDGPAMSDIQASHSAMSSRDDVILAGYRTNALELVAGADVCVVPSLWAEAFGLAALEPMAAGVPVIASNIGGLPEVVGDAGVLVEAGNAADLSRALLELLTDSASRRDLGLRGRVRAQSMFSRQERLQELVSLIEPGFPEEDDR